MNFGTQNGLFSLLNRIVSNTILTLSINMFNELILIPT